MGGLVFGPVRAKAEDLRFQNQAWNGLSELLEAAAEDGPVQTPKTIDVTQLSGSEGILVVHPVSSLPAAELAKFMRRGGRVAVADDFGAGSRFFGTFGMTMSQPGPSLPQLFRKNPALPIASPIIAHALADGVGGMVTNHPQVLQHPSLTPVFGLTGEHGAVVLSGAVGSGRLVAISDASVLINNMLELSGNRAFARNLARYLRGADAHGRLLIADSATEWEPSGRSLRHPLDELKSTLARLSHPQLPRLAVIVFSTALAGLLLGVAATSLPRSSAYARRAYLQSVECNSGMAGRVSHYAAGDRSLLAPLLSLKRELERRAADSVRASAQLQRVDLLRALTAAGHRPQLSEELGRFMAEVDRLQDASAIHAAPVSVRQFSELVATGRRILTDLDAPAQSHHERHG